jgi:hypothetical protein
MMNTYQIVSDLVKIKSLEKIAIKLGLMFVFVYIFSYIIYNYYSDSIHWYNVDSVDNKMTRISWIDSVFHSISCWFTVGFGEIIPRSTPIKILSILIMTCAYIITVL